MTDTRDIYPSLFVHPPLPRTVLPVYSPEPLHTHTEARTKAHTPLFVVSIHHQESGGGAELCPRSVAGLWGAAGLPVDSHIKSYSLHRNTIIQEERERGGKLAPPVEY